MDSNGLSFNLLGTVSSESFLIVVIQTAPKRTGHSKRMAPMERSEFLPLLPVSLNRSM